MKSDTRGRSTGFGFHVGFKGKTSISNFSNTKSTSVAHRALSRQTSHDQRDQGIMTSEREVSNS
jgi:hypothetical protein